MKGSLFNPLGTTFSVVSSIFALAQWSATDSLLAQPKPNFILFLADDLGWTGLGCYGSDLYETPHLDRLAKEGIKFTDAYAACTVCSPSRAAILTGKYPARLHLTDFISGQNRPYAKLSIPSWEKGLKHEEITLAEALRTGGYRSAHIGKWHLHTDQQNPDHYDPVDHGFDRQVFKPGSNKNLLSTNAGRFKKGDFVTDYLADEASRVIDEWKAQPFFLYFAFHVPHTPVHGKASLVNAYRKKVNPNATHQNPHYAAMVHSMDDAVGTIVNALEKNEISDQTVILFTSDNGGLTQRYGKLDGFTDNAPLRRGKGSAYEGGVRVPLIVKWPGVTDQGRICKEPVIGIDIYPTFLVMAQLGAHPDEQRVDGLSLVSLLKAPDSQLSRGALFWHYPHYHAGGDSPYSAIRARDWRLVHFFEDDSNHLFHLGNDLGETNDLATTMPQQAQSLRLQLDAWRSAVGAQFPSRNPSYDPNRQFEVKRKPKR